MSFVQSPYKQAKETYNKEAFIPSECFAVYYIPVR